VRAAKPEPPLSYAVEEAAVEVAHRRPDDQDEEETA
jgi:hypothetical protein